MSTKIMAVTNQKGGVAKTTTVVNIAACAAEMGQRVLVVDVDPQASATSWLTLQAPPRTVWHVLAEESSVAQAVVPSTVAGVAVLGAEHEMHSMESLVSRESRPRVQKMFAASLAEIAGNYDLVVIDCPGTLDLLTVAALVAATEVVIPVLPDVLSLTGAAQLMTTIDQATKALNPALQVAAVVPCRVNARNRLDQEVLATLVEEFGDKVTHTVRESVRAKEAVGHHQALTTYAPSAGVTQDYRAVTAALLSKGEK